MSDAAGRRPPGGRVRRDGVVTAPKRPQADRDLLGIKAARLHYDKGFTHAEVQRAMAGEGDEVRSARDVSLLISGAMARGVIQLSLRVYGPTANVHTDLSRKLTDKARIEDAIVAETGDLGREEWDKRDGDYSNLKRVLDESDLVHLTLGRLAARAFIRAIRPEDRIGLGSGRGVGFTVDALKLELRRDQVYPRCRIYSLVGGMTRVPWTRLPENLDADNNAGKLAAMLGGAEVNWGNLISVQLPTFLSSGRDRIVAAEAPHLMGNPAAAQFLEVCLVGLGVLNEQHHLLRGRQPEVRAIKSELATLRQKVLPRCPNAILDVCEHFAVGAVDNEIRPLVGDLVARLNEKVVSTAPATLKRVRERIFVAGTAQKYQAVKSCLTDPGVVRPTVLVTDEATAHRLLKDL